MIHGDRFMHAIIWGAVVAGVAGTVFYCWYSGLSEAEKKRANELMTHYARLLFNKAVDQLVSYEAGVVRNRVRDAFAN
jgi:hypothetical protein